jgi:hypothetical protein
MSDEPIRVTAGRPGPGGGAAPGHGGTGHAVGPRLPIPTEVIVLALTALAVLIAAAVDDGFGATPAWGFVTVLAAAYIFSRGLVKRGHGDDGL